MLSLGLGGERDLFEVLLLQISAFVPSSFGGIAAGSTKLICRQSSRELGVLSETNDGQLANYRDSASVQRVVSCLLVRGESGLVLNRKSSDALSLNEPSPEHP